MATTQEPQNLPIVMVHGMWGCEEHFRNWRDYFNSKGHKVHVITLPGHGDGSSIDNLSVLNYANFAARMIRNDIGPCIVIGHSMGGVVARLVASQEKNVKRVVVVGGAASKGIRGLTLEIFCRIIRRPFRYVLPMFSGKGFTIHKDDARALMMNCMDEAIDPGDIFPFMESGKAARELSFSRIAVRVRSSDCPMLVVAGEHDRMTPPSVQNAIRLMHHAKIYWHRGGHMPMLEKDWRGTAREILAWIQKVQ